MHSKINGCLSRALAELNFASVLFESGEVDRFDYEEFLIELETALKYELDKMFPEEQE